MLAPRHLVVGSFLAATIAAQTVHQVGPGGFGQIQDAINAAANGDVIVIQSGTYLPFTLAKDLRLTAAPGAAVDVITTLLFNPLLTIVQPPTQASITGLRFRTSALPWTSGDVRVLGGTVHLADCWFESARGNMQAPPGLRVQNANVAMQRCLVLGGGLIGTVQAGSGAGCDGLAAAHANIAAVDCVFWGGNLHWDFIGHGGHGVSVDDSTVHFANCIAIGGSNDAINPGYLPGNGVHIATTSRVWLADSELRGGTGHNNTGGAGLANFGGIAARTARSTFFGGAGQPQGAAVVGALVTAPLLGLAGTTPPIGLGSTWTIGYRTTAATPVLGLWSDRLAPTAIAAVAELAWLPATAYGVAAAGVTDANGLLTFAFAVPATPALLHATFHLQSFAGATLPLEASPPVGGVVR